MDVISRCLGRLRCRGPLSTGNSRLSFLSHTVHTPNTYQYLLFVLDWVTWNVLLCRICQTMLHKEKMGCGETCTFTDGCSAVQDVYHRVPRWNKMSIWTSPHICRSSSLNLSANPLLLPSPAFPSLSFLLSSLDWMLSQLFGLQQRGSKNGSLERCCLSER